MGALNIVPPNLGNSHIWSSVLASEAGSTPQELSIGAILGLYWDNEKKLL